TKRSQRSGGWAKRDNALEDAFHEKLPNEANEAETPEGEREKGGARRATFAKRTHCTARSLHTRRTQVRAPMKITKRTHRSKRQFKVPGSKFKVSENTKRTQRAGIPARNQ